MFSAKALVVQMNPLFHFASLSGITDSRTRPCKWASPDKKTLPVTVWVAVLQYRDHSPEHMAMNGEAASGIRGPDKP